MIVQRKVLSKLLVSLMTASLFLSGCGAQETTGKVDNHKVEEKKETGNKTEDSTLIEDISWSWSVSDYELWQLMRSQGDVSIELFEGTIDYADGSQGKVKPDKVTLEMGEDIMMYVGLEFRGDTYFEKIQVADHWGDGEPLSDEELEEIKKVNSSETSDNSRVFDENIHSENEYHNLMLISDAYAKGKTDLFSDKVYQAALNAQNGAYGVEGDCVYIKKCADIEELCACVEELAKVWYIYSYELVEVVGKENLPNFNSCSEFLGYYESLLSEGKVRSYDDILQSVNNSEIESPEIEVGEDFGTSFIELPTGLENNSESSEVQ